MKHVAYKFKMLEAGRKFYAFLICVFMSTAVLLAATQSPTITQILPVYLTSLGGFLTVYLTGNVAHRHVELKNKQESNRPQYTTDDMVSQLSTEENLESN